MEQIQPIITAKVVSEKYKSNCCNANVELEFAIKTVKFVEAWCTCCGKDCYYAIDTNEHLDAVEELIECQKKAVLIFQSMEQNNQSQ